MKKVKIESTFEVYDTVEELANPIQVLECNYLSTFYAPGKTNLCNVAICMVHVCMYLPIHLGLYMNIYLKVISYT